MTIRKQRTRTSRRETKHGWCICGGSLIRTVGSSTSYTEPAVETPCYTLYQLMHYSDRQDVAAAAGLTRERTLRSWLKSLNTMRNICAHNSRLWKIGRAQCRPDHEDTASQQFSGRPGISRSLPVRSTAWAVSAWSRLRVIKYRCRTRWGTYWVQPPAQWPAARTS